MCELLMPLSLCERGLAAAGAACDSVRIAIELRSVPRVEVGTANAQHVPSI